MDYWCYPEDGDPDVLPQLSVSLREEEDEIRILVTPYAGPHSCISEGVDVPHYLLLPLIRYLSEAAAELGLSEPPTIERD